MGRMKFTALDVNVGDSFLLTDDETTILVDGGKNKKDIKRKLKQRGISYIDVVICTHYDSDHLNGIIGIANSAISIGEIWLPDILGDMAYTMTCDNFEKLRSLLADDSLYKDCSENATNEWYNRLPKEENGEKETQDIEIDVSKLDFIIWYIQTHCIGCLLNPHEMNYYLRMKKLCTIMQLVSSALRSGARIRWLKYENKLLDRQVTPMFNLVALNARETYISKITNNDFSFLLYYLTTINKESLVFKYKKENFPNVLFTADSDFSFLLNDKKYALSENSLVTAPHHGSTENAKVYKIIEGNKLIYVRSDRITNKRPCKEYIDLRLKYCTVCNNSNYKQKVVLWYCELRKKWVPEKTQPCRCSRKANSDSA